MSGDGNGTTRGTQDFIRFQDDRSQNGTDLNRLSNGWQFDCVSIGYPHPVIHGCPMHELYNLAGGWVGFNFGKALDRPVKVINDAATQARGSYQAGQLLFLGVGAGLGSAMIVEGMHEPMELRLPYKNWKTYEDYVGGRGLKRLGKKNWHRHVADVVKRPKKALEAEYVVLGGGTARLIKDLRRTLAWVTTGTRLWAALASGIRRTSRSVALRKSLPEERR